MSARIKLVTVFSLFIFASCSRTNSARELRIADETHPPCAEALVEDAQPNDRISKTEMALYWAGTLAVVCPAAYGAIQICYKYVYSDPNARNFFYVLAGLAAAKGLTIGRRLFGPQSEKLSVLSERGFFSFNGFLLSKLMGRKPRVGALGTDHFTPDIYPEINARLTDWQSATLGKISSLSHTFDWLGLQLLTLLRDGDVEQAANEFVAISLRASEEHQEVLLRTVAPHIQAKIRTMLLVHFRLVVFSKLQHFFRKQPSLSQEFQAAVQNTLDSFSAEERELLIAYGPGLETIVHFWMKDLMKQAGAGPWAIQGAYRFKEI
jgi:hypothetical protein